MPPFGPRASRLLSGKKDEDWFSSVAMLAIFGPLLIGVVILTAPVWIPATVSFLATHPGIPAAAFWAVVKAKVRDKNALEAGLEAGLDSGAVVLIEEFLKKYFKFIPSD